MGYPLNAEGYVDAESAPVEPLSEDLEAAGRLETDHAGVEAAPTLSNDAVDALDNLAARMHGDDPDTETHIGSHRADETTD